MAKLVRILFSRAEVQQMLAYVNSRDQGEIAGWYYAPRKDFERRHESIKAALERGLLGPAHDSNPNGGSGSTADDGS